MSAMLTIELRLTADAELLAVLARMAGVAVPVATVTPVAQAPEGATTFVLAPSGPASAAARLVEETPDAAPRMDKEAALRLACQKAQATGGTTRDAARYASECGWPVTTTSIRQWAHRRGIKLRPLRVVSDAGLERLRTQAQHARERRAAQRAAAADSHLGSPSRIARDGSPITPALSAHAGGEGERVAVPAREFLRVDYATARRWAAERGLLRDDKLDLEATNARRRANGLPPFELLGREKRA